MSEETNNQPQAQNANVDLFGNIQERDIAGEMRSYYIDYAMSVIVGRALPDVRDGTPPCTIFHERNGLEIQQSLQEIRPCGRGRIR